MIVSLFDYTGIWCQPYRDAGYEVVQVDIQHGRDVYDPRLNTLWPVHGVLAAPPCTDFANSGARWFREKDEDGRTATSVRLVYRTLDLIRRWHPQWWCLENPPGRIHRLVPELGQPSYKFSPNEFGEPWSKPTWLWGEFNGPEKREDAYLPPSLLVAPTAKGGWYNEVGGKSLATKNYRSRTSTAFALQFFKANP
jgi:hypothetical protein